MLSVETALRKKKLGAKMLLQVHDELILDVPEEELEETINLTKQVMESVATLDVPLVVDTGFGKNWGEAH